MRDLSNIPRSQVNHLFRGNQPHINGRVTKEQKSLIQPLAQDIAQVEKMVEQNTRTPLMTVIARLFSLM
jgi:hypothetical protein